MTLEQAASECKISLRYYQNLEAGDRWPSPEIVRKLASGFDVKQYELFQP
ncbi:helix-turn-helix transcriptional regulator [Bdellovibrio bacteriovorus]